MGLVFGLWYDPTLTLKGDIVDLPFRVADPSPLGSASGYLGEGEAVPTKCTGFIRSVLGLTLAKLASKRAPLRRSVLALGSPWGKACFAPGPCALHFLFHPRLIYPSQYP